MDERMSSHSLRGVNKGVVDNLAQSSFMEYLGPKFDCRRSHGEHKCEQYLHQVWLGRKGTCQSAACR